MYLERIWDHTLSGVCPIYETIEAFSIKTQHIIWSSPLPEDQFPMGAHASWVTNTDIGYIFICGVSMRNTSERKIVEYRLFS